MTMDTETGTEPTALEGVDAEVTEQVVPAVGTHEADDDADDNDDTSPNGAEASEEARADKPKRPRWSDVNRANREALDLRRELDQLKQQAYRQPPQPEPAAAAVTTERPTLESCNWDQEAHAVAVADWRYDQRDAEKAQKAETERTAQTQQQRVSTFNDREAEFIDAHPDYDAVARADNVPITEVMVAAMLESPETAPAVAYYLGKNIDEAAQIAQMPPIAQARAIGRIEAQLGIGGVKPAKPAKPTQLTRAPAPVPTVSSVSPVKKSEADMSDEERLSAIRASHISK